MPVPMLWFAAVGFGLLHALFAQESLERGGLRRMLVAASLFAGLILLPAQGYLLRYFPAWSYLYFAKESQIPSAVDLLLLIGAAALVPAFARLGARWLEQDARYLLLRILLGLAIGLLLAVPFLWRRLSLHGSYSQFVGGYGLRSWLESSLAPSLLLVWATLAAGLFISARALRK